MPGATQSPRGEVPVSSQLPCTICGHTVFTPGPNGRLTKDGLPPNCARCRSLERHRIIYGIWETIARHYPLRDFTCLQFAEDPSIRPEWFKELHVSVYGGVNSMDLQQIPLPDKSLDIVICNHVLEHVADDARALREMLRITRPNGFVQLSAPVPLEREKTEDWGYPDESQHGHYRIYSADIMDLFAEALPAAYLLSVIGRDLCTGARDVVFLLSRGTVTRPLVSLFPKAYWQRLEKGTLLLSHKI